MEDMCYERRRAEAIVNQSAHRALGVCSWYPSEANFENKRLFRGVCVYYCSTYYKAVCLQTAGAFLAWA